MPTYVLVIMAALGVVVALRAALGRVSWSLARRVVVRRERRSRGGVS